MLIKFYVGQLNQLNELCLRLKNFDANIICNMPKIYLLKLLKLDIKFIYPFLDVRL